MENPKGVIGVPKGLLRLAALKLLSESSMSGTDLANELERITEGDWDPGPGSVYLVLKELLKQDLITELPRREGNTRRYIISRKGKEELASLAEDAESDVLRQLKLLGVYSALAGKKELSDKVRKSLEGFRAS